MPEIEILILLVVILAFIAVYYFLKTAKHLIVNTVLGLIILAIGQLVFDLGINITLLVLLICAIGGIPGAILVILLHTLGVAF